MWVIKEKFGTRNGTERTEYQEKGVRSSFTLHTQTAHLPLSQAHIGRNVVLNIDPTHLKKARLTTRSL